jgi:hypothetical protein
MPFFPLFMAVLPCMFAGWYIAEIVGWRLPGAVVLSIGVMLLCMFWFSAGIVASYKTLDLTQLRHFQDGEDDKVHICLKLGPFEYRATALVLKEGGKDAVEVKP